MKSKVILTFKDGKEVTFYDVNLVATGLENGEEFRFVIPILEGFNGNTVKNINVIVNDKSIYQRSLLFNNLAILGSTSLELTAKIIMRSD